MHLNWQSLRQENCIQAKLNTNCEKIGTWTPYAQKTISFRGVFQLLMASKKQPRVGFSASISLHTII